MESYHSTDPYPQQLPSTPTPNPSSISTQRKLLSLYCNPNSQKCRKSAKHQLFTMENIEGLFSVLGLEGRGLQFVPEEQLANQVAGFMQSGRKGDRDIGEFVRVEEGKFVVLVEGCLAKKMENHLSVNVALLATMAVKHKRTSSRDSSLHRPNKSTLITSIPVPSKKPSIKRIESWSHLAPKLIPHDFSDQRPYECRSEVHFMQFCCLELQKLGAWVEGKEREGLGGFLGEMLGGIQDRKMMGKLVPKLVYIRLCSKKEIEIENDMVYVIFRGVVRLRTERYEMELNRGSIMYKNGINGDYQAVSWCSEGMVIGFRVGALYEILEDSEEVLKLVKYKLNGLEAQRNQLFQMKQGQFNKEEQLKQPVFDSEMLNFKSFDRTLTKKQSDRSSKNSIRSILSRQRPLTCQNSKRFRVNQHTTQQITLSIDQSIFLRNYPYAKLVESEQIAHKILKKSATLHPHHSRHPVQKRQASENEKRKIEKQIKRLFYNDKVRRLKIRNIAEKLIPNGHRKNFDADKAEKQISEYLLFKNIIEYPMNGVSQNAHKQAKGKKLAQKFAKMSSVNSRLQRKTTGNHDNSSKYQPFFLDSQQFNNIEDSLQQLNEQLVNQLVPESHNNHNPNQNQNERTTTLSSEYLKTKNQPIINSSYCQNLLNPHLRNKTQNDINFKMSKRQCSIKQQQKHKQNCQNSANKHHQPHFQLKKNSKYTQNYTKTQIHTHTQSPIHSHNPSTNPNNNSNKNTNMDIADKQNDQLIRLNKMLVSVSKNYTMFNKRMKTIL